MGYYIETGTRKGKAAIICRVVDSARMSTMTEAREAMLSGEGVVVVVDNGAFEAAGFAYSSSEFEAFARNDGRIKRYIVMDRDEAERLSGYSQRMGTG